MTETKLERNPVLDAPLPEGYLLQNEGGRYCVVTSQGFPLSMTFSSSEVEAVRNYHQLFGGVPVYVSGIKESPPFEGAGGFNWTLILDGSRLTSMAAKGRSQSAPIVESFEGDDVAGRRFDHLLGKAPLHRWCPFYVGPRLMA